MVEPRQGSFSAKLVTVHNIYFKLFLLKNTAASSLSKSSWFTNAIRAAKRFQRTDHLYKSKLTNTTVAIKRNFLKTTGPQEWIKTRTDSFFKLQPRYLQNKNTKSKHRFGMMKTSTEDQFKRLHNI